MQSILNSALDNYAAIIQAGFLIQWGFCQMRSSCCLSGAGHFITTTLPVPLTWYPFKPCRNNCLKGCQFSETIFLNLLLGKLLCFTWSDTCHCVVTLWTVNNNYARIHFLFNYHMMMCLKTVVKVLTFLPRRKWLWTLSFPLRSPHPRWILGTNVSGLEMFMPKTGITLQFMIEPRSPTQ
jgi:hypothetical protein